MNDPYPRNLDEMPFAPPEAITQTPEVKALNRIAVALEQLALAVMDRPAQPQSTLTALPPVRPVLQNAGTNTGICAIHGLPWKIVPAGVSKKTGLPYDAFQACPVKGCDQRPPRA